MKLRIKFSKTGSMKYIGHLDIMRYFQKAIRRSGIPIKYSEGFSPHQIMSFAAPLGIGLESIGEYFDITLEDNALDGKDSVTAASEYKELLDAEMCPDMSVVAVRVLPDDAKKCMAAVARADYEITGSGLTKEMAQSGLNHHHVYIHKATKSGDDKELDIKPLIYSLNVDNDVVSMCISQGSVDNIKPEYVINALGIVSDGPRLLPEGTKILRTELRDENGISLMEN